MKTTAKPVFKAAKKAYVAKMRRANNQGSLRLGEGFLDTDISKALQPRVAVIAKFRGRLMVDK
jgi:hypothetical protein